MRETTRGVGTPQLSLWHLRNLRLQASPSHNSGYASGCALFTCYNRGDAARTIRQIHNHSLQILFDCQKNIPLVCLTSTVLTVELVSLACGQCSDSSGKQTSNQYSINFSRLATFTRGSYEAANCVLPGCNLS